MSLNVCAVCILSYLRFVYNTDGPYKKKEVKKKAQPKRIQYWSKTAEKKYTHNNNNNSNSSNQNIERTTTVNILTFFL